MVLSNVWHELPRLMLSRTMRARYMLDAVTYRRSMQAKGLASLAGCWRGRAALIVANGPSLNRTPLDEFIGVPSIGMNKIDLIYPRVKWRPSLVVCENNLVARQNSAGFMAHDVPVYLSWKSRWLIPHGLRRNAHFFLTLSDEKFHCDLPTGIGSASTVTFVALQFAYYLGANPVVLIGADHSFAYAGKPNEYRRMDTEDVNHFDSNYFAKGTHWGIPNLKLSEEGYVKARQAFENDGRVVYDATVGGKLSVFKKMCIADAISMCRR